MITLKFARQCRIKAIETVELTDYEAFFRFYMENNDRGIIFDVKEIEEPEAF